MKKVFISFSEKDRDKVSILESRMKKSKYLDCLIVSDKNSNSELIANKIVKGITSCQYFITILTNNSINNQWVNQEIGFAKSLNLEQEIIPIIDINIINKLNGFINKEIDIPFSFKDNSEKSFNSSVNKLINWLEIKNGKKFNLESIFDGLWRNDYKVDDLQGLDIFEIKNGYWYDSGVKLFKLENFSFNDGFTEIQFIKVDITRKRQFHNTLQIINNSKIKGNEDNGAFVLYRKLPTPPLNEFYKKVLNKLDLPIDKNIKIRLIYENGTHEVKIGYVIGEIEHFDLIYEVNITYYKFIDKIKYKQYINSGETLDIYLIPEFVVKSFENIQS